MGGVLLINCFDNPACPIYNNSGRPTLFVKTGGDALPHRVVERLTKSDGGIFQDPLKRFTSKDG